MKNQTHTGAALPQPRLVRPLEVGCVVTTNGGKKHTIAEIGFGGSEGVAEHPFYHWDKDWPYEIEHAAMNPETDAIVSVSWPNTSLKPAHLNSLRSASSLMRWSAGCLKINSMPSVSMSAHANSIKTQDQDQEELDEELDDAMNEFTVEGDEMIPA